MAFFSNGTEGMVFDEECSTCIHGEKSCPISLVQMIYNYEARNNKVAREILDTLVSQDGKCAIKKAFPEHFCIDAHQLDLFNKHDKHGEIL